MKAISPLVAAVMLIAITMTVAVLLSQWATTSFQQTVSSLPTCIGGRVDYLSAEYPKWNDADKSIIAAITAYGTSLSKFKFEVRLVNDTILTFNDRVGLSLAPGATGTVISTSTGLEKSSIKDVWITTNCSDVKTTISTLK